ncbi:CHAT domain-containing protein [Mycena leptocephala]|nr:CHAT domain-containing protein [Mycena leptocephala]
MDRLEDRYAVAGMNSPMNSQELWVMHESILLLSNTNKSRARFLNMLGDIYFLSYQRTGVIVNLNQAICAYGDAVRDDPTDAKYQGDLGVPFRHRFERLGHLHDLNQSLLTLQRAVDLNDISKSVLILQEAIALLPAGYPGTPSLLGNLGASLVCRSKKLKDPTDMNKSVMILQQAVALTPDASLLRRFQQLKNPDDINNSVKMIQQAVELTPNSDQNKAAWLYNLGNCLGCRFEQFRDLTDINQSVLMFQQAVQLTPDDHPNKPRWLKALGNSLCHRFKHRGNLDHGDLNELTLDGHPGRAERLDDLGRSLEYRFQHLRDLNDINESVLIFQQAHPNKPIRFTHLGNSFRYRFEQLGDLNDLNESVTLHPDKPRQLGDLGDINKSILMFQQAAELIPDGDPDRPALLNNFGNSLVCRYEWLGDHDDINEAALKYQQAVILMPDTFSGLGNSLSHRFEQMGHPGDIEKSIWASRQALKLTADGHPDKSAFLNSLDPIDINESVMIYQQAVKLLPVDHPHKPASFSNLGNSLSCRFEQSKDLGDLNESILMLQQAAELTPDGHPDKPGYLNNLSSSLWARFQQLRNPDDQNQILSHYMSAACSSTGPASMRFYAASITQHPSLLHAYSVALGLLPDVAWLGLSIHDRRVVRDAYHKAVEWLEQGRSVIWEALRETYPDLADKFISLSMQLEGAGIRAASPQILSMDLQSQTSQSTAQQYHERANERDRLLKEIRGLSGFERFLLPKTMSELSLTAGRGPIVLLNISEFRCDALVLMSGLADEVLHIPLPNFTFEHARRTCTSGGPVAIMLSELWSQVVKPVLDGLSITTPSRENPQRIWWCPTGPLSFLPIHAAGLYGDNEAFGSKLSDFVISSYDRLQLLAVAQPSAVGQAHIPGTREELDHIERLATGNVAVMRLEENAATVGSIQQGMKDSRWVHFACHGVQDMSAPTQSALLLAGSSQLTLSNIIELSLPHADFAFLSACQTATGTEGLSEESAHLAAGMLWAGYHGVIATMWSIMDHDAPQVAADLCEGSDGKKSLFHWVPFIHVGF